MLHEHVSDPEVYSGTTLLRKMNAEERMLRISGVYPYLLFVNVPLEGAEGVGLGKFCHKVKFLLATDYPK